MCDILDSVLAVVVASVDAVIAGAFAAAATTIDAPAPAARDAARCCDDAFGAAADAAHSKLILDAMRRGCSFTAQRSRPDSSAMSSPRDGMSMQTVHFAELVQTVWCVLVMISVILSRVNVAHARCGRRSVKHRWERNSLDADSGCR